MPDGVEKTAIYVIPLLLILCAQGKMNRLTASSYHLIQNQEYRANHTQLPGFFDSEYMFFATSRSWYKTGWLFEVPRANGRGNRPWLCRHDEPAPNFEKVTSK